MKQIQIFDTTLCAEQNALSFKEKLEIARKLERLSVDAIELPEITSAKADTLLIRTISTFVKNSVISVAAAKSLDSVRAAADSLKNTERGRIRIELPVTAAIMEYSLHIKQNKMCDYIRSMVEEAKKYCDNVEFCAVDATRAEPDFLKEAVDTAVAAGTTLVTLCDTACIMLPDDFASFVENYTTALSVPVGVSCNRKTALSVAASILSVQKGASCVKTSVQGDITPLRGFGAMISSLKENYDFEYSIRSTELHRVIDQIEWIISSDSAQTSPVTSVTVEEAPVVLDINDTKDTVTENITKLGYDLSDEDTDKVYSEFRRIARKKKVTLKELDAIVASSALQVPSTYELSSYVINSGNIITASAQIKLLKNGREVDGISTGDGPIDAAFKALDAILGRHFELDDFRIQTVTGEKEAMGNALVRLRTGGRIYSGTGVSTDIIGASIRAYLNAVNKIVYEED
ncbi:MAG: hypothetical protein IJH32_06460 [Ruminococcus sp.]|nr:hypothetical protein [Ruminococcus sp.]